ncbi:MAG: flagellar hook-basal body complex protein [Planctomycetaceae bacterium]|nr:flagellar hook-basal body complex protein [Planctomycetaceae bacterium]
MSRSLISALGGLRSHQGWLDVIGNNLANQNTPAFKSSRAVFSSLLSRTLREGTPASTNVGGTNPVQVGLGTQLSYIDRDIGQGSLNLTGRTFDLALLGRGYFALTDGDRTLYTRVGSFGLDAQRNMVDLRTGFRVLNGNGQAFQIDTDAVVPPNATSEVSFQGNLPAKVTGPLAEQLGTVSALYEGTPAEMTGSNAGPFNIPNGVAWSMEVIINGGAPQTVSITGGAGPTSAADIAAALDDLDHVSAEVGPGGEIQLVSDKNGTGSTIKITPGEAGADLASTLGLGTALVSGTQALASGVSSLNSLTRNLAPYSDGDGIEITGSDADGTPIQATFVYGTNGTTVDDLVSFIDSQFTGATASFNPDTGTISLAADATGESELSLVMGDNGTGKTDWAQLAFTVTTNGAGPDTVNTSMEVFDSAGTSHILTLKYIRQDNGTWNIEPSLPEDSGTVTSGPVTNVTFNQNGSLLSPPSANVTVQFQGQSSQTIQLKLGNVGGFDGVTQFGAETNVVAADQDGYGVGSLANMSVGGDGRVTGFYTNGETLTLGQFGVATFANEGGLAESGDNYWTESSNSGQRLLGVGLFNGSGEVVGGALEESNVDTAEEFVRLIQAQRGFQANARIISVQDTMLEEIVNMV